MDELKKHITKNRAELDRIEAPNMDKIWAGVQSELNKNPLVEKTSIVNSKEAVIKDIPIKKNRHFTLWIVATAASVALLIGIGIGYFSKPSVVEPAIFNIANYAPELKEQEQVFRQLVSQKMDEIDVENIDKTAFVEVFDELEQLDKEYENWTEDVPQFVHEQELIEFLTRHYEQKIRILEILTKEIEKKAHFEEREISL